MTGDELREIYLNFFRDKGHMVIPSSSVVPYNDPSLLFTSAGMVPIKPYYLGLETPPSRRLVSCQKCFRTTDIDLVGDSKHLTFFEMLGNFSVGDYFKKETISWAWEFITRHLRLPEERLWITIYLDDDEAFDFWRGLGFPAERILRFDEDENFWGPVGDSGPCGPDSEIHYDLGEESGCGKPECRPNCDCGRFCEIWNLVFTQYNQDAEGHRTPLATPNIDTGMGVERTLAVIEGKPSPYETSLFLPLVNRICRLSAKEYGGDQALDRAIRVVSDHSRSIAFLIADGVVPSNEGRGYVLRRVLRRASLFGQKLGLDDPFLNEMIEVVLSSMGHVYPELVDKRSLISAMVKNEEERFATTLDTGLNLVEKLIGEASVQGREGLEGGEVFRLYDTYGFPPELTAEIAGEKGLSIDWEGFQAEMEKQRARARVGLKVTASAKYTPGSTHYVGDITLEHRSAVVLLISDGKRLQEQGDSVSQGQDVDVILRETPFYGEMGGQVGDVGEIRSPRGKMIVTNTIRIPSDLIVHRGRVIEGDISVGDEVEARVDVALRQDIARNHTATHLLQAALRQMVDPCTEQKGSLVEPEGFRFDFSYLGEVTEERLHEIQRQVNDWIRQNLKTGEKKDIPYRQAIAEGAIALFEEKYGEKVRMLEIGEPAISKELCGGTHVNSTGEIGLFLITSESSIGTGLHRIEAVTGRSAESLIESRAVALQNIAKSVESSLDEAPSKVEALVHGLETERKRTLSLERELLRITAERLVNQVEQLSDVTVLTAKVPALSMPSLREMGDVLRDKLKSAIVVLATIYDGKPSFLTMVTPDLIARGFHAGDIINQVARVTGGGGGGKAAMAQAGGKDPAKVDEALRLVRKLIEKV